jgi:hypothetical protein
MPIKKVKKVKKPKTKADKDVYEEVPRVEVDHKKDSEVLEISLDNLKRRKASLQRNPIFNRDLDNGPEVYG